LTYACTWAKSTVVIDIIMNQGMMQMHGMMMMMMMIVQDSEEASG
jgi:hypothetical protein